MKTLLNQKTTWAAIAQIVTAAGAYATGEITGVVFAGAILAGLQVIFLRQAVNK
jgi:hypothetical protein